MELLIAKLQRMQFGRSSEKVARQIERTRRSNHTFHAVAWS
jgi:hypothetical protein